MVFLFGCQVSTTKLNDNQDKILGQTISARFYDSLQKKDYRATVPYFAKNFIKKIGVPILFKYYKQNEKSLGTISGISVSNCQTKATSNGAMLSKVFLINFIIKRTNGISKERLILRSVNNEVPKIYTYQIQNQPN
ncbi:hypothetical protein ACFOWA_07860 [Pedobacter lithocola]|uniref:Uncharacterized protein n=1 Tax=Pedobacter lithocola TaxID=1908239 RepID=A0ABV8PAD6_9SPHI